MNILDRLKMKALKIAAEYSIPGNRFRITCPKCGQVNVINSGDFICFTYYHDYAKYVKNLSGEYPTCRNCGEKMPD